MIVSRTPDGLSVLAEKVTGISRASMRNGRKVNALLMAPHTGFGQAKWWEPDDPQLGSWWDSPTRVTTHPALRVHPDGTTTHVTASVRAVSRNSLRESAANHVNAGMYTVSHVPIAEKYPAAFPTSPVGTLLVAAGQADFERSGELVIYTTTSSVTEDVHGDVTLRPHTADFDLVERRVETATKWVAGGFANTNRARVVLAVRHGVSPQEWRALEPAAEKLLGAHTAASIPPGPIWDAIVAGFMSAILEDGIHAPEDLYSRHRDYQDVMLHLNSGGNVDELMHSLIPRWMRHPVDLVAEILAS